MACPKTQANLSSELWHKFVTMIYQVKRHPVHQAATHMSAGQMLGKLSARNASSPWLSSAHSFSKHLTKQLRVTCQGRSRRTPPGSRGRAASFYQTGFHQHGLQQAIMVKRRHAAARRSIRNVQLVTEDLLLLAMLQSTTCRENMSTTRCLRATFWDLGKGLLTPGADQQHH